jgi:uncharacterized protein (TIGR02996 family)
MADPRDLPRLLRACKDDPTDDTVRRVLADFLEDLGDVDRAEFVRLQLDTPPGRDAEWDVGRAERLARLARLQRRHASDWVDGVRIVEFERGLACIRLSNDPGLLSASWPPELVHWLERVTAPGLPAATWHALCRGPLLEPFSDLAIGWESPDPAEVLSLLERTRPRGLSMNVDNPSKALLRSLARASWFRPHRLELPDTDGCHTGWKALAASSVLSEVRCLRVLVRPGVTRDPMGMLAATAPLDNLRRLEVFGDGLDGWQDLLASDRLTGLTELHASQWETFSNPSLGLALAASRSVRHLRRLYLYRQAVPDEACAALAAAPVLEPVERLELDSCHLSPAAATALLASPRLGNLATLDLCDTEVGDAGLVAVANSSHLGRLRRLNLANCGVTSAGLRALLGSPHFVNLEELVLSTNFLGDEGLEVLAGAGRASLRRLELRQVGGSRGWAALLRSPLLAGIVSLDLGGNDIAPADVEILAQRPDLATLRTLNLNSISMRPDALRSLGDAAWLNGLVELNLNNTGLEVESFAALLTRLTAGALAQLDIGSNRLDQQAGRALLAWPGLPHLVGLPLSWNRLGDDLEQQIQVVIAAGPR